MKRTKLFCFPYAGGSAAIFNKWGKSLNPGIELVPVELAGRGTRFGERLYGDLSEATEDMMRLIGKEVLDGPYALFGHSMGCLICYELAQKIRDSGLPQPCHLFFSGRRAPHIKKEDDRKIHLMDDPAFRVELIGMGGTPPEFFESPELLELFLPILKNDFRLAETEIEDREIHPLDSNISIFVGTEDKITLEQANGWGSHTRQQCRIHYFDGGHFFIKDSAGKVIQLINETLLCDLAPFLKY